MAVVVKKRFLSLQYFVLNTVYSLVRNNIKADGEYRAAHFDNPITVILSRRIHIVKIESLHRHILLHY